MLLFETRFENVDHDFRKMTETCMKLPQNRDLGVWVLGICSKLRSEANGDGPGPQNPDLGIENDIKTPDRPLQRLIPYLLLIPVLLQIFAK